MEDPSQVVNRANPSYNQIESNEDDSWNLDDEESEQDSGVNTPSKELRVDLQDVKKKMERMYYADWIRVIAVHFVIFVHSLMNAADTTELSNHDAHEKKEGIFKCMVQIGMPMFFYISGMSATFFNAEKHGFCFFVKGKVQRLLVPLLMSILVFLIPRLYLSQDYEAWTRVDDKIESNFFVYAFKVFPSIHTKLSWLWFLVVLFIVMLLNYPLVAWT